MTLGLRRFLRTHQKINFARLCKDYYSSDGPDDDDWCRHARLAVLAGHTGPVKCVAVAARWTTSTARPFPVESFMEFNSYYIACNIAFFDDMASNLRRERKPVSSRWNHVYTDTNSCWVIKLNATWNLWNRAMKLGQFQCKFHRGFMHIKCGAT